MDLHKAIYEKFYGVYKESFITFFNFDENELQIIYIRLFQLNSEIQSDSIKDLLNFLIAYFTFSVV